MYKMGILQLIKNYAAYNFWANDRIINWLKDYDESVLNQSVPSSYDSILKTMAHNLEVEKFWLKVITPLDQSYEKINAYQKENIFSEMLIASQNIVDFTNNMDEESILTPVTLDQPWANGTMPRFEFLHHCLNHSTYHRGQIITIAHQLNLSKAPSTDQNFYNLSLLKK